MTKIKNILRCYAMGMGIKSISNTFAMSRNTVRKYVRRFQESGLPLEKLLSLSEEHIDEMFAGNGIRGRAISQRREDIEAMLPEYAKRLKIKGITVKSLYNDYSVKYPNGYKYAQFNNLIRRYRLQTKVIGQVDHLAGDQMYIDFAGNHLSVTDAETGEKIETEVFVAILPCSQYTYCEAVWSQKKEDLILACENAMHYFGGVPMAIVPDNLKSAVTRSNKHEPMINEEFAAFAEFYNCAVYPARVRHPQDKALVENAVKLMYRSVYKDVEGKIFNDIDTLNAAIHESLKMFNNKKLSGRDESRRSLFDEVESGYLQPLPANHFQLKSRKSVTVLRNSYITLNKHHYSMPKEYIGKRVDVIYDADTLKVFYGLKLVTTHDRDDTPYGYTRKSSHNLPGHHGSYEKDMDEIYQRASEIDNIVLNFLQEVAVEKKYPPSAFRACKGILSLEKRYGPERLVSACACASQYRRYSYYEVKEILERGEDVDFITSDDVNIKENLSLPTIVHKNIRGRDYFTKKSSTLNKKDNGNN